VLIIAVYLSGSKEDYSYWAEIVGDDTWKWENSHRRLKEIIYLYYSTRPGS
jgi:hypothetical protein